MYKQDSIGKRVGFYLVLEGVDLCGKSTLAVELVKELVKIYGAENVIHRKEPSESNYGLKMREVLLSGEEMTEEKEIEAAKYMLLDRLENTSTVSKLLRENKIIVQERNFLTALVYNEAGHTEEVKFIQEANKLSLKPDVLFLVTVSDSAIQYRLERVKEERGELDSYETFESITRRKKDYFKFDEYISEVLSNDSKDMMERNIKRILKCVENNYSLLLNQPGPDTNFRGTSIGDNLREFIGSPDTKGEVVNN